MTPDTMPPETLGAREPPPANQVMESQSLEEQSLARKQKLEALRKRKHDVETGVVNVNDRSGEVFKFRNYDPDTGKPKGHDTTQEQEDTVEKEVEGLMDRIILDDEVQREQELDLVNIQPKKPNWDLKRDYEKKLAKLEPQTQRAIAQLIRQRLQGKSTDDAPLDIAAQMSRQNMMNEPVSDDEED